MCMNRLGGLVVAAWMFVVPASAQLLRPERAPAAAAALDSTPPVLTQFEAPATLNVAKAAPPFSVLIKATDDLSGVRDVFFFATGPSGQRIFAFARADWPSTSLSRRVGLFTMFAGRLLEPGTWTFDQARIEDLVGNPGKYNQAQLAALGNTTFTVLNTGNFDKVAPTLSGGQILTPSVSLSAIAKGTAGQAPFVGVKLSATDTGNSAVAGLAGAAVAFCSAGDNPCVELWSAPSGGSLTAGTLFAGAQVGSQLGHVPGDYQLYSVVLWDQAGNLRELVDIAQGGTTDFSTLFPTTKLTLKP